MRFMRWWKRVFAKKPDAGADRRLHFRAFAVVDSHDGVSYVRSERPLDEAFVLPQNMMVLKGLLAWTVRIDEDTEIRNVCSPVEGDLLCDVLVGDRRTDLKVHTVLPEPGTAVVTIS